MRRYGHEKEAKTRSRPFEKQALGVLDTLSLRMHPEGSCKMYLQRNPRGLAALPGSGPRPGGLTRKA